MRVVKTKRLKQTETENSNSGTVPVLVLRTTTVMKKCTCICIHFTNFTAQYLRLDPWKWNVTERPPSLQSDVCAEELQFATEFFNSDTTTKEKIHSHIYFHKISYLVTYFLLYFNYYIDIDT